MLASCGAPLDKFLPAKHAFSTKLLRSGQVGGFIPKMADSQRRHKLIHRLRNRSRIVAAKAYLSLRSRLSGGTFWIDLDGIKLPFHGDGDLQEIYYYLDGKEWWDQGLPLMARYIRPGGVAIDVGANLGFASGIFSALTGETGQVYSFEPSPTTYAKLLEVIQANQYKNVSPYNLGCGRDEQSMTLYCPTSSGNATFRPDASMEQSTRNCPTVGIVNLDNFLGSRLERLDFLKIDTEGYEDEVLAGAAGLLKRFNPIIYIEFSSQYLATSENAARILRDLGYTFEPELRLDEAFLGDNFFALPRGYQAAL